MCFNIHFVACVFACVAETIFCRPDGRFRDDRDEIVSRLRSHDLKDVFPRSEESDENLRNCFSPPEKLSLENRRKLRKKFEFEDPPAKKGRRNMKAPESISAPTAAPSIRLTVQRHKFPPIFFIPQEHGHDFHANLISALVCRNVLEFKKRFPSMPRMVIASTLAFSQKLLQKCTFGTMSVHKVWFLTWEPFLGEPSEHLREDEFGCFDVSNRCDYIMFRGHLCEEPSHTNVGDEKHHQKVVRKYMDECQDKKTIAQLSRSSAAVLVQCQEQRSHTSSDANIDPVFLSIHQLLRALQPNTFDSRQRFGCETGSSSAPGAPTVFVVAGASQSVRFQYTLAFRSASILLVASNEPESSNSTITVVDEKPLSKFYVIYRSVYRVLESIEQVVRYFCHHAARKNGKRFVMPAESFCLRDPGIRNIRGICQQMQKFFENVIRDTHYFKKDDTGAFDVENLKAMFDCIEENVKRTGLDYAGHPNEASPVSTGLRDQRAWFTYANHKRDSNTFDSKYKFSTRCSFCEEKHEIECTSKSWKCLHCGRGAPCKGEQLIKGFQSLLDVFGHEWWEVFEPSFLRGRETDLSVEERNRVFYNPIQEIQQICESDRVFCIPDLQPAFLSFAFSRIAIESHLSPDVRLLGETALMAAVCSQKQQGHDESPVELLLKSCSISQVLSKSEHPQALDLDALFMSVFYLRVDDAEKIADFVLDKCKPSKTLHVFPFCTHSVLKCTTFMLACRYGSSHLLGKLFQLLELWIECDVHYADKT